MLVLLGLENLALESILPPPQPLDHSQEDINLEKPFLLVRGWKPGPDWSSWCLIKT